MPDVIMPRLSDSMEEGTILRWLKRSGETINRGEELVEIETDKATMIYEADDAGVLSIAVEEGATVPVGAVIGQVGVAVQSPGQEPEHLDPTPQAAVAEEAERQNNGVVVTATARDRGLSASPVARRTATRLGVDLAAVQGTGPSGRIVKADVIAAAQEVAPAAAAPQPVAAPAAVAEQAPSGMGATVEALSRTQALIARRMVESRMTVPDFAVEVEVDMSAAIELRSDLKQQIDPAPSFNDIVVKAVAVALTHHPRVNGSYRENGFELHSRINVGIAVAADNILIVPTVFDADRKRLGAIAAETRDLIARSQSGNLSPSELSGGTFTVSNLGMFGVDRFTGIINSPEAAILCVGAITQRPVAVSGEVVIRPIMSMTLAADHRILYGADAARFLEEVRDLLERPLTMLV